MSAKAVFAWARLLAPFILANIPKTRGIAPRISSLMDGAEVLLGEGGARASGPEKLQYVTREARAGMGQAADSAFDHALQQGIDAAFTAAKTIEATHGGPAPGPGLA